MILDACTCLLDNAITVLSKVNSALWQKTMNTAFELSLIVCFVVGLVLCAVCDMFCIRKYQNFFSNVANSIDISSVCIYWQVIDWLVLTISLCCAICIYLFMHSAEPLVDTAQLYFKHIDIDNKVKWHLANARTSNETIIIIPQFIMSLYVCLSVPLLVIVLSFWSHSIRH